MRSVTRLLLGITAIAVAACNICERAGAAEYSVTELGTLGGAASGATAINNKGQIVGSSNTGQVVGGQVQSHAFLYQDGVMTDLGALPTGHSSGALGINDLGQIVGESYTNDYGPQRAFLHDNGSMIELGTLAGQPSNISIAYQINASGQVVGFASAPGDTAHAFVYQNGSMTDLGTLGGANSYAFAINAAGQIVGHSETTTHGLRAFFYQNGQMVDLGTLGGYSSLARSINDAGQVVGSADTAARINHAFLYQDGQMTDLGTLYGSFSYAIAINAAGQVIGDSAAMGNSASAGERVPFLYQGGSMIAINDLLGPDSGWTINNVNAINDLGWMVGAGTNRLGQVHAVLLKPVPEPGIIVSAVCAMLTALSRTKPVRLHIIPVSQPPL